MNFLGIVIFLATLCLFVFVLIGTIQERKKEYEFSSRKNRLLEQELKKLDERWSVYGIKPEKRGSDEK